MSHPTKIATCCFCGATTALRLAKGQHQLSCASCGAPLRELKMLRPAVPKPSRPKAVSHQPPAWRFPKQAERRRPKPKKVRKRKPWLKNIAEELFDLVEDIFD